MAGWKRPPNISGQLLNLNELARDTGIAASTARDWLSVLQAANQLLLLEPYFNNPGKRMVKTPKLYFCDTGLLCFLCGLTSPQAVLGSPSIGSIWETFVLNQIVRAQNAAGVNTPVWFWRDAYGTEVDFVLEHEGRLRLVETKWAESITDGKSLPAFFKVKEALGVRAADEHWIVCRTAHTHPLRGYPDVRVINGFTFQEWTQG